MNRFNKNPFARKQKGTVAILWIVCALWLFSTAGCSEIENPDEDGLYLYAKVENASEYKNVVTVKLMLMGDIELARGKWKGDGFTIFLPKMIKSNCLHALINNNRERWTIIDPPPTVTISNENVKVYNACFWGFDKKNNMVTRFYPIGIDEDGFAQDIYYTYVDSDVSISGYKERMNDTVTPTDHANERNKGTVMRVSFGKITTTYLVNWKRGWNVWGFSYFTNISEVHSIEEYTATEKWTSASNPKWYSAEDLRR